MSVIKRDAYSLSGQTIYRLYMCMSPGIGQIPNISRNPSNFENVHCES